MACRPVEPASGRSASFTAREHRAWPAPAWR